MAVRDRAGCIDQSRGQGRSAPVGTHRSLPVANPALSVSRGGRRRGLCGGRWPRAVRVWSIVLVLVVIADSPIVKPSFLSSRLHDYSAAGAIRERGTCVATRRLRLEPTAVGAAYREAANAGNYVERLHPRYAGCRLDCLVVGWGSMAPCPGRIPPYRRRPRCGPSVRARACSVGSRPVFTAAVGVSHYALCCLRRPKVRSVRSSSRSRAA